MSKFKEGDIVNFSPAQDAFRLMNGEITNVRGGGWYTIRGLTDNWMYSIHLKDINPYESCCGIEKHVADVQMRYDTTIRQIADTAIDTISDRGVEYDVDGKEERSMAKIVAMFNACEGTALTERQGWAFMQCLKMVRQANGGGTDCYIDDVAYSLLKAECFLNQKNVKKESEE